MNKQATLVITLVSLVMATALAGGCKKAEDVPKQAAEAPQQSVAPQRESAPEKKPGGGYEQRMAELMQHYRDNPEAMEAQVKKCREAEAAVMPLVMSGQEDVATERLNAMLDVAACDAAKNVKFEPK